MDENPYEPPTTKPETASTGRFNLLVVVGYLALAALILYLAVTVARILLRQLLSWFMDLPSLG